MFGQIIKANLKIITLIFIFNILNTRTSIAPKLNLGNISADSLKITSFLQNSKEIKAIEDIDENAVLLLFIISTKLDGEKIAIKPVTGPGNDENGFSGDSPTFVFSFTLSPADQYFKLIRSEIKGKQNILEISKALAAYKKAKTSTPPSEVPMEDLKIAWEEVVDNNNNTKSGLVKIVESEISMLAGIKDKTSQNRLKNLQCSSYLLGESFFELCKPFAIIDFHPWNDSDKLNIRISCESANENITGRPIPPNIKNENDEKFEVNLEEKDPNTIEKLKKVFEKNDEQLRPYPNPKTPNTSEEDDPFYKKWWFIVLVVVIVVMIALGVTLIYRRSIFGTKKAFKK